MKSAFHGGINLIVTVTTPPYIYDWTNVSAGTYTLTGKVTDSLNGATTSAPVDITVTAQAALYYSHPDDLNSPRVITNAAQQVVWRWDNDDPFGGNMANENPSGLGNFTCNLRFTGQYFDKETNYHYNTFRDYSPEIGRYIESDPIGLRGGINTHGYVGGIHLPGLIQKVASNLEREEKDLQSVLRESDQNLHLLNLGRSSRCPKLQIHRLVPRVNRCCRLFVVNPGKRSACRMQRQREA